MPWGRANVILRKTFKWNFGGEKQAVITEVCLALAHWGDPNETEDIFYWETV